MLRIKQLSASVNDLPIIHDVSLDVGTGQVHAIMGPNGSGKSTLAQLLMGHPAYTITAGSLWFKDTDITSMTPDARARAGIFLALQNPYAIPGVRVRALLKEACRAVQGNAFCMTTFNDEITTLCALLLINQKELDRSINDGFSGGEKKKFELLQMLMLKPALAILDEIDSGLDVDALAIIGRGIAHARQHNPTMSIILITHYQRILEHIVPDQVHIVCQGRLAQSGDLSLVRMIESRGYDAYR
jgi:Fe-S cluster assembly ATP-binding protein